MADVTDRESLLSKIAPIAVFKTLKEYIADKIDSIDEDFNIYTHVFQHVSGYFASIAFLTTLYGISYIDDQSTYIAIATSLLAFSSFLAIDFFQKYEKHQLLHLVNRTNVKYPSVRLEKVINRDVPVLFVWEPSISSRVFFTWCNPLAVAMALIANTEGIQATARLCLFGVALLLGLQIRTLLAKYDKKIEDKKLIFEEGAYINSQFYERNYVLASPEHRLPFSHGSPLDPVTIPASSGTQASAAPKSSNSSVSPTKPMNNIKDNSFSEYGTNYAYLRRNPTPPMVYANSPADVSPPRRESPVRSASSSGPSSRQSSMEFPSTSGLFSIMDNTRPSFYGQDQSNGSSGLYNLANAPPYTPHIGMNGAREDNNIREQEHQRRPFGLDQDPPTSSIYDY